MFQRSRLNCIFWGEIPRTDYHKIQEIERQHKELFDYFMIAAPGKAFRPYHFFEDPVLVGVIEIREHPFLFRLYGWK